MRLIDADALINKMYHDAFETDTDMQKWDGGCWIRYKMFENAIDEQPTIEPKQGEWIPCSERLPTLSEDGVSDIVLLCWSDGQMTVGAYQGNRTFCGQAWPEAKDRRVTVVAWQPLPKPWKGAE